MSTYRCPGARLRKNSTVSLPRGREFGKHFYDGVYKKFYKVRRSRRSEFFTNGAFAFTEGIDPMLHQSPLLAAESFMASARIASGILGENAAMGQKMPLLDGVLLEVDLLDR